MTKCLLRQIRQSFFDVNISSRTVRVYNIYDFNFSSWRTGTCSDGSDGWQLKERHLLWETLVTCIAMCLRAIVDVSVDHCNGTLRKMFSKRKLFTTGYCFVKHGVFLEDVPGCRFFSSEANWIDECHMQRPMDCSEVIWSNDVIEEFIEFYRVDQLLKSNNNICSYGGSQVGCLLCRWAAYHASFIWLGCAQILYSVQRWSNFETDA